MNREEANKKISELVQASHDALREATELAEMHEIEFTYTDLQGDTMTFREKQVLEWAASSSCEWETSNEYSYTWSWMSSTEICEAND